MEATGSCMVIVVAETDKLNRLAQSAVEKMGANLRLGRAVEAEAKRFAEQLAAKPTPLRVEVFDVVGFSNPLKDRPDIIEPIVLHEGRPVPVANPCRRHQKSMSIFAMSSPTSRRSRLKSAV